ncbi:hypothetical protein FBUS_01372 [Fasciolopsis buskii]|uniref:Uncharacterized protein n=1 Tax=Fasciolopsis buskii TaxID=27845 RepID=A0A8E0RS15_9TREM|nr:hypothetical protein FBUS_01372 [Fasciolopsis buski]
MNCYFLFAFLTYFSVFRLILHLLDPLSIGTAQQIIPLVVSTTSTTLLESLHYLDIYGPQHTRVRLNESIVLRCRVTFVIVNRTHASAGNSMSVSPNPTWYGVAPGSVQPNVPLAIQWMKDGFGYDQDTLWHTFNGRYRITGSKDKGERVCHNW